MGPTGAGGGILSEPLLVFFLHLPMALARQTIRGITSPVKNSTLPARSIDLQTNL